MNEPDYIVAQGTGSPSMDGTWFDRSELATLRAVRPRQSEGERYPDIYEVGLHPTGMIEVREAGAVAEIWAPETWVVNQEATR